MPWVTWEKACNVRFLLYYFLGGKLQSLVFFNILNLYNIHTSLVPHLRNEGGNLKILSFQGIYFLANLPKTWMSLTIKSFNIIVSSLSVQSSLKL